MTNESRKRAAAGDETPFGGGFPLHACNCLEAFVLLIACRMTAEKN